MATVAPIDDIPNTDPMTPAELFNGYVGAHVIFALHRLGALRHLAQAADGCRRDELALAAAVPADRLGALLDVTERLGYVEFQGEALALTRAGREVVRQLGFFTWGVGGYGELLRNLEPMARGDARFGREVCRDEAQVASGSGEVDAALMRPIEDELLAELDFTSVADLGCGGATRLIRLCGRDSARTGLGIDISESACGLARKNVANAGLAARVTIVHENVERCFGARTFPGVDLVTSFLMMHDLFNAATDGGSVMRSLRETFPDARYFLIADTTAQPWPELTGPLPIFSLGFELLHSFMDVRIQPRAAYEDAFAAGGLAVERCVPFGAPSTWLYLLTAK
jgi:histidinol-phosphate aminotransferase